eukprot:TRINITY_DN2662_c0_g1_i2.p1 TRINITY_DN2662_c0_g1~~TRINITY_DN2662_c0_g1_i2.p1  ORF type:complete len:124 (+),score=10.62 TRINITY_DN2662_c0_g1_i2:54-374(+)
MSYYGAPIARQGSIAPAAYGRPSFAAPAYGAQNCGPCGPQRGYAQARPAYGYPGQYYYGQRYAPRYIDDSYYSSEEVRPVRRSRRTRTTRNVRPAGSRKASSSRRR